MPADFAAEPACIRRQYTPLHCQHKMIEEAEVPDAGSVPDEGVAEGMRAWPDRLVVPAAAVLAVCYITDVSLQAFMRPLWFDELISYYVTLLPDLGTLWEALRQTADGQPPVLHLAMRSSHALFGTGEWATRLPSIAAVGAMSWALYVFVGRRAGAVYGIAATLFAWNTWAYEYAYEARPYGLLMGLTGLAFLCWRAVAGERRNWALAGLAACLVALMSSHYYAGLLIVPLAVGEMERTRVRKMIDRATWCVLGLSPFSLLLHLPLLLGVRAEYLTGFWSPVEWMDLYGFYIFLLAPVFIPVCLTLLVLVIANRFARSPGTAAGRSWPRVFPSHERAALYALAATPMVYVLATTVLTGAFVYRYPLAAVFGISAMFAEVLCSWLGPRSKAAWFGCAVLFGAFLVNRLIPSTRLLGQSTPRQRIEAALDQVRSNTKNSSEPIVFSSPQLYLQYNHYAAAALRSRLVYAADPEAAIEFTSANTCDVNLIKLAPWRPARVTDYERFLAENSCFFVVHHKNRRFSWMVARLRSEGEELEVVSDGEAQQVLRRCKETAPISTSHVRRRGVALRAG